jgi:CcmD family protein
MMRSYDFLFWGTTTVWVGIVAYLAFLGIRLRRVHARLLRLEREAAADQKDSA